MPLSLLTYICVVQITTHINAKDSGDVFDVLQDGLNQGKKASLVKPYAEVIDQSLFRLAVTPNGSVRCPLEIFQQRIQMVRAQREIPYDQLYDLTESGMYNSELLACFLGLCLVAEEHLKGSGLVLVVLQRGYAQRHDGQRDADYPNTCQRHGDVPLDLF